MMTPNQIDIYRANTAKQPPYTIAKLQLCPSCQVRRSVGQFAGGHQVCAKCRGR